VRVTRLGHACLLIEADDTRLLIDPGNLSDSWHDTAPDAVLVTHQHLDHFDSAPVRDLLARNPGGRLIMEGEVAPLAAEAGMEPEVAAPGDAFTIGSLGVETVGGRHAVIHPSIPRVGNVGYVISEGDGPRLYHPGDAYEYPLQGIDVLAVPLSAPWARVAHTADFVSAVAPSRVFPIHDGHLSSNGLASHMRLVRQIAGMDVEEVWTGDSVEV